MQITLITSLTQKIKINKKKLFLKKEKEIHSGVVGVFGFVFFPSVCASDICESNKEPSFGKLYTLPRFLLPAAVSNNSYHLTAEDKCHPHCDTWSDTTNGKNVSGFFPAPRAALVPSDSPPAACWCGGTLARLRMWTEYHPSV